MQCVSLAFLKICKFQFKLYNDPFNIKNKKILHILKKKKNLFVFNLERTVRKYISRSSVFKNATKVFSTPSCIFRILFEERIPSRASDGSFPLETRERP